MGIEIRSPFFLPVANTLQDYRDISFASAIFVFGRQIGIKEAQ